MYPSINIPAINIPAVTGKIYVIIENLTDIIEELNKDPSPANSSSSAQICALEGIDGLDGDGGGRGNIKGSGAIDDSGVRDGGSGSGGGRGEAAPGGTEEKRGLIDPSGNEPNNPESQENKGVDLFRYLSSNEGLELIRLESTRKSLLRAQGFLEEKKQVLIGLARSRQVGK
jgi:hypothetical protein